MQGCISSHVAGVAPVRTFPWYAIRTKSNHEKTIAAILIAKGYEVFLPEHRVQRHLFGRSTSADAPLFPGYVFCRFDISNRIPILRTPGVVKVVTFRDQPAPIPDGEIDAIRVLLASGSPVESCDYLSEGQRVRIRQGPFQDLEGILIARKSAFRFVVSIPLLQRSVAVEIDPVFVSPV